MWFWINRNICSLESNPFRKMVKEASSLETRTVADTCVLNGSRQPEIAVWSLSVTESISLDLSLSPTNSQETVPLYDFLNILTQFFFFFWLVISSSHRLTHYFYFLRIKVTLFIGMVAWRLTPRIIIAWRETKVKHMHLKESETREIIKMRVMLIQFAKVYKALLHIWSIIIYNKLGGK